MKIAIKFHDSDFRYTFLSVLEIIKKSERTIHNPMNNKDLICKFINSMSFALEVLRTGITHIYSHEKHRKLEQYLKISEDKILINEEVDEYIQKTDKYDRSDLFCVYDSDLEEAEQVYELSDKEYFEKMVKFGWDN